MVHRALCPGRGAVPCGLSLSVFFSRSWLERSMSAITDGSRLTMPAWGWLMMGLGIFFTLVIGGGLMILIFYSSRAGYDEAPQIEYDDGSHAETSSGKRNADRECPQASGAAGSATRE